MATSGPLRALLAFGTYLSRGTGFEGALEHGVLVLLLVCCVTLGKH